MTADWSRLLSEEVIELKIKSVIGRDMAWCTTFDLLVDTKSFKKHWIVRWFSESGCGCVTYVYLSWDLASRGNRRTLLFVRFPPFSCSIAEKSDHWRHWSRIWINPANVPIRQGFIGRKQSWWFPFVKARLSLHRMLPELSATKSRTIWTVNTIFL
jgi:hypothetical protein